MRVSLKSYAAVCLALLAGCDAQPKPEPKYDGSMSDAPLMCQHFGGLKDARYERRETYKRSRITIMAECIDGSEVWRWTDKRR